MIHQEPPALISVQRQNFLIAKTPILSEILAVDKFDANLVILKCIAFYSTTGLIYASSMYVG
jgi:hypothetical protein